MSAPIPKETAARVRALLYGEARRIEADELDRLRVARAKAELKGWAKRHAAKSEIRAARLAGLRAGGLGFDLFGHPVVRGR